MNYKVHRLDINRDNMQQKLENFLNGLQGEILSIVPIVKPTLLLLGGTAKVDSLLIVEKI